MEEEEAADPTAEEEIRTEEPEAEQPPENPPETEAENPPEDERPPEDEKPAEGEKPPEEAEEKELTPSEQEDKDAEKPFEEKLADLFRRVYNNKYYMDVIKATAIFLLALKIANELKKISIPLRDYQPFQFNKVCTCGRY